MVERMAILREDYLGVKPRFTTEPPPSAAVSGFWGQAPFNELICVYLTPLVTAVVNAGHAVEWEDALHNS